MATTAKFLHKGTLITLTYDHTRRFYRLSESVRV